MLANETVSRTSVVISKIELILKRIFNRTVYGGDERAAGES